LKCVQRCGMKGSKRILFHVAGSRNIRSAETESLEVKKKKSFTKENEIKKKNGVELNLCKPIH